MWQVKMAKKKFLGKKIFSRQKQIFARQKKCLLGNENVEKVPSFGLIKIKRLNRLSSNHLSFQMILMLKYLFFEPIHGLLGLPKQIIGFS
jgi:hypothetical protein